MKNWKLILGILLVAGAAGFAAYYQFAGPGGTAKKHISVNIRFGSEKKGLLSDVKFQEIMKSRYGITINGTKMGSLEMSEGAMDNLDGLWPSSELAAELFKNRHPEIQPRTANIFNTPIVLYSWPEITEALIKQGVVEKREDVFYVINMKKLLDLHMRGSSWRDLGLPRQNGQVNIIATDPTKSNSGFLMAGLIAVILNDGAMVGSADLSQHLPEIKKMFAEMGFLEHSTGVLFDKYIKQGQGAFPLVAGYESLIIEFYTAYPSYQDTIKKLVRTLVPEPTVWSDHPFIALTENGQALLDALQDPEIQALAWERYGFRSGVMGINNDPAILKEIGLPPTIDTVTRMPPPPVMESMLEALRY